MEQGHLVPKRCWKGRMVWAVREISGTMRMTPLPSSTTVSMSLKNTELLPLPVTPVEQRAAAAGGLPVAVLLQKPGQRLVLGRGEHQLLPLPGRGGAPLRPAVHLVLEDLRRPLVPQSVENGKGSPRKIAQLFFRGFPNIQ